MKSSPPPVSDTSTRTGQENEASWKLSCGPQCRSPQLLFTGSRLFPPDVQVSSSVPGWDGGFGSARHIVLLLLCPSGRGHVDSKKMFSRQRWGRLKAFSTSSSGCLWARRTRETTVPIEVSLGHERTRQGQGRGQGARSDVDVVIEVEITVMIQPAFARLPISRHFSTFFQTACRHRIITDRFGFDRHPIPTVTIGPWRPANNMLTVSVGSWRPTQYPPPRWFWAASCEVMPLFGVKHVWL